MCMDTCTFSHFLSPQSWECQCPQVVKNRCCYIHLHTVPFDLHHGRSIQCNFHPRPYHHTEPQTWGFMNDKTKFLATPGRVTSTMRAIMVSNNFSEARFELQHLQLSLEWVILGKTCQWLSYLSCAAAEVPILIRSAKIDESCLQCWERFWGRTPGHCLYVCCPSCTERQCLQGPQFQDIALPARHRFAAWWGNLESSALSMWDWHVIDTSSSLRQAASLMHLEYTSNGTSAWALPRCFFMRTPAHPQRTTRRVHLLWGPLHQGPRAGHQCYGGSLCSLCSLVGSQVRSFRLREGKFEIGKHWCKQCKRMVCTAINIASVRIIWAPVGPCVHFSCIALVALSAQLTLGALS